MNRLAGAGSGSTSPARQKQHPRSKNFRRNTLVALGVCLTIMFFAAIPSNQHSGRTERELRRHSGIHPEGSAEGVLQKLQPHTLTVEECTDGQCTKEVVNVHDTAMLQEEQQQRIQQQNRSQDGIALSTHTTDSRLGTVSIQKQVGRPLIVTVKQDESDPGQHVESGGALLTDEAKDRVATLNQASSQRLDTADPAMVQKAAEIADELSTHSAAAHREGDNVLEMHRDDIDTSSNAFDTATLSNRTQISDENILQILQDSNSTSLLSGFNSESLRAERDHQQGRDSHVLDLRIGSARQL